jgi:hypothetical protein
MSARVSQGILVVVLTVMGIVLAGCISTSVGDVAYKDGNFSIAVTSPKAADAYIQVTVFRIADFQQVESAVFETPVSLVQGENRVIVPGQIGPGEYKLYVYVIDNGTRRTAVIRDIRV